MNQTAEGTDDHSSSRSTTSSFDENSTAGHLSVSSLSEGASLCNSIWQLKIKGRRQRHGDTILESEPSSRNSNRKAQTFRSPPQAFSISKGSEKAGKGRSNRDYVHPKHGAHFQHLTDQQPEEPDLTDAQAHAVLQKESTACESLDKHDGVETRHAGEGITYDFRDHRVLPRPVLSRPGTPSGSPFVEAHGPLSSGLTSRTPSHSSDSSRRGSPASRRKLVDNDPWLGSEGAEKWKDVRLSQQSISHIHRNLSFDRSRAGHPENTASEFVRSSEVMLYAIYSADA